MKLSTNTRKILANFAMINPSIILTEGNEIRTIATGDNIFGWARIEETIPHQVGIYSISEFLKALSIFSPDADVNIEEKQCILKEGPRTLKYTFSNQDIIKQAPDKLPNPPRALEIVLPDGSLDDAISAAGALGLELIQFKSDGTNIKLSAASSTNPDADSFEYDLCPDPLTSVYNIDILVENLRLIKGSYKVGFAFAHKSVIFEHSSGSLQYFIASELSSNYPETE